MAKDAGDALILSVNNLVESWILDFGIECCRLWMYSIGVNLSLSFFLSSIS